MPKKQKCSHNPRNLAVSIYSHERKKGTPVTRARDGPGSQESLDLAAFPTLHYVFLVIKTTVSTWHEDTELLSHSSCPSVRSGSGTDRGTCPFVRSAPGTDRRVFRPCERLQELIDGFVGTCQCHYNKAPADVYQPGGESLSCIFDIAVDPFMSRPKLIQNTIMLCPGFKILSRAVIIKIYTVFACI